MNESWIIIGDKRYVFDSIAGNWIPEEEAPKTEKMFEVKCDCGGQYFGSHSHWCSTQVK